MNPHNFCFICSKELLIAQPIPSFDLDPSSIDLDYKFPIISDDDNLNVDNDLWDNLCYYMGWEPPKKYQINFSHDDIPLCKDCRSSIHDLFTFNFEMEEIRKRIQKVVVNFSVKILESKNEFVQHEKEKPRSSKNNSNHDGGNEFVEKAKFYRNEIVKRYSVRIKLQKHNDHLDEVPTTDKNSRLRNRKAKHMIKNDISAVDSIDFENNLIFPNDYLEIEEEAECIDNDFGEFDEPDCLQIASPGNSNDGSYVPENNEASDGDDSATEDVKDIKTNAFSRRLRVTKLSENSFIMNKKFKFEKVGEGYQCTECGSLASDIQKLKSHMRQQHFLDEGFPCTECRKIFPTKRRLKYHLNNIHKESRRKSEDSNSILTIENPTEVLFVVNGKFAFEKVQEDEYKCGECGYLQKKLERIKTHMRRNHVDKESCTCPTCGKSFKGHTRLQDHLLAHEESQSRVCEDCGKVYKTVNRLEEHRERMHLGKLELAATAELNFPCPRCDKKWVSQQLLNKHINAAHVKELCQICGKSVSVAWLPQHVFAHTHSEVKAHECPQCGKKFRYSNSLWDHIRRHNGLKPYSCDICGKAFNQHQSMMRHKRIVHKISQPYKDPAYVKYKADKRKYYQVEADKPPDNDNNEPDCSRESNVMDVEQNEADVLQ